MGRDPFTNAVCRQAMWFEDAVQRRGNLWDWKIGDETDQEQRNRHTRAADLCHTCPNYADDSCADEHVLMTTHYGEHPGVWAGTLHTQKADQ